MNAYRRRPNRIPWPPLILALTIVAAVAAGQIHPLPLAFPFSRILGYVIAVTAVSVDIWAAATLLKARTTVLPNRASSHLVTGGPFRFSRNPIYLAYMVLLVGLGLITGNAWFLPAALVHGIATHFLAVRREESHLIALFGYKYEDYCRAVRRWI
jgi:Putative protein-S-isoprenylcysteine methyltransferase